MDCLHLAVPPARPNQLRGFRPRQPAITWQALFWQAHADDATMQAFLGMVVDCGPQILKIAPRPAVIAPDLGIRPAVHAGHFRQHLAAPPTGEPLHSFIEFRLVCLPLAAIFVVNRQHVRHIDASISRQAAIRAVLFSDVRQLRILPLFYLRQQSIPWRYAYRPSIIIHVPIFDGLAALFCALRNQIRGPLLRRGIRDS